MEIWLDYADLKKSLFLERHMVCLAGLSKAPKSVEGKDRAPEEKESKDKLKSNADQLNSRIDKSLQWIEKTRDTIKKSPYKDNSKIKEIDKKLGEVHEKLDAIYKKAQGKKAKVREVVLQKFDEIMTIYSEAQEVSGVKIDIESPEDFASKDKPNANPEGNGEKNKKKPSESKEAPLSRLDRAKQKLGRYLDEVIKNPDKFKQLRSHIDLTISTILRRMRVDIKNVEKTQYLNVPGGYRMSIQKWMKNQDKMPNTILYKGNDLLFYRDYGVLRQASKNNMDSANRTAQIVKCFDQFPKSFMVTNNKFRITNKDNFAKLAMDISRYSRKDKSWTARLSTCRISYNSSNNQISLVVRGLPGKIVYNPSDPHKMKMIPEGETSAKAVDISNYVEKPKEKEARKAKEKKQAEAKKRREAAKRTKEREAASKRAEAKALRDRVSTLINPAFKKLIKKTDKPNSFTVHAEKKDRKGLRLINKTPIHTLLSLEQGKGDVVKISINGEKGKREAMYYPGQRTAYEVNAQGKQTNKRIRFYNGDTITVNFKEPKEKYYANLNGDKQERMSPERIEGRKLFANLQKSVKKFKRLKGKLSDLNLKPLKKFESGAYDPKKILTGENWAREVHVKRTIKESLSIVKAELAVIAEGIDKKEKG